MYEVSSLRYREISFFLCQFIPFLCSFLPLTFCHCYSWEREEWGPLFFLSFHQNFSTVLLYSTQFGLKKELREKRVLRREFRAVSFPITFCMNRCLLWGKEPSFFMFFRRWNCCTTDSHFVRFFTHFDAAQLWETFLFDAPKLACFLCSSIKNDVHASKRKGRALLVEKETQVMFIFIPVFHNSFFLTTVQRRVFLEKRNQETTNLLQRMTE